jgi:hypothetical protein
MTIACWMASPPRRGYRREIIVMSYLQRVLQPGEQVRHISSIHRIVYWPGEAPATLTGTLEQLVSAFAHPRERARSSGKARKTTNPGTARDMNGLPMRSSKTGATISGRDSRPAPACVPPGGAGVCHYSTLGTM